MSILKQPIPIDNEIILDPTKVIMSKTDKKGIIEYVNTYFNEISGYDEDELIGKPHNIIRHPDMPKVVFKLLWERLHKGENVFAVIKNLAKDGSYYWVITSFETTRDTDDSILSHYARKKAVPKIVKETTEALYKSIIDIEKHDVELAEKYFYESLEKYDLTYDSLLQELAGMNDEDIYNYFQSTEQNTNTTSNDIVIEIDSDILDKQGIFKRDESNDSNLQKMLDKLESQVVEVKNKIKPKDNSNGFLGSAFDELKKELKSDIQIKKPLK